MEKIFFQSSLPRSGSTVLQNILSQNPDIYGSPTSGLIELLAASRTAFTTSPEFKAQDRDLMKKAFHSYCNKALFGFYEAVTDKRYVVDKCRGWEIFYDFVHTFYPNPKVICMVRDLRDIVSSMEKKYRENPDIHSDIVDWTILQGTTTLKRANIYLANKPLGASLDRIWDMVRMGIDKKVLIIKYEELCVSPEVVLKKVYDYLEIPYFNHDFNHIEQYTAEDDLVYGIYGDHKIRNRLFLQESDAEIVLGSDICKALKENYAWYFDQFGYK